MPGESGARAHLNVRQREHTRPRAAFSGADDERTRMRTRARGATRAQSAGHASRRSAHSLAGAGPVCRAGRGAGPRPGPQGPIRVVSRGAYPGLGPGTRRRAASLVRPAGEPSRVKLRKRLGLIRNLRVRLADAWVRSARSARARPGGGPGASRRRLESG